MSTIYSSRVTSVPIPTTSIFSFLFPKNSFDPASPAFIDSSTGFTLSRNEVKNLSLSLAYGLRNELGAKRGDTAMIFRYSNRLSAHSRPQLIVFQASTLSHSPSLRSPFSLRASA